MVGDTRQFLDSRARKAPNRQSRSCKVCRLRKVKVRLSAQIAVGSLPPNPLPMRPTVRHEANVTSVIVSSPATPAAPTDTLRNASMRMSRTTRRSPSVRPRRSAICARKSETCDRGSMIETTVCTAGPACSWRTHVGMQWWLILYLCRGWGPRSPTARSARELI